MATGDRLRQRLVRELRERRFLTEGPVAAAFAAVPRHVFVPGEKLPDVYTIRAFITKRLNGVAVSSSSEPSIMAVMLQQLDVQPGHRVLEIGAGTGYNAGLLAHLAGESGRVTTVDIDDDTAAAASQHLNSAGYGRVRVRAGDGGRGHAPDAPYDRIIATAGCWQLPQPWIDQLADGGVLVLPLRVNGVHLSLALRKHGDELVSDSAALCGFMPMRGAFAPPGTYFRAGDVMISADVRLEIEARSLERLMATRRLVRVSYPRSRDQANYPLPYLALQGAPFFVIYASGTSWGPMPFTLLASDHSAISLPWFRPGHRKLTLFGTGAAARYLREALARWRETGRPDTRDLRMRVRRSNARLGALPKPSNDHYRFRRGDHAYDCWFEA